MAQEEGSSVIEKLPIDFNIVDEKRDKRLQLRYCDYDCGTCLTEAQLIAHRESCPYRPKKYNCMICSNIVINGRWNRIGEDFLTHIHDQHHHKIVNLSDSDDWIVRLDAEDPAKMLFLYNEKYIKNECYWIEQFYKDDAHHINVQHLFSTDDTCKLTTYEVQCKDSKFVFQAHVIPRDASSTDITLSTLDVSQLSKSKSSLMIQFYRKNNIPKTVLTALECVVCKDFMRGKVLLCNSGHSMCVTCVKKLSSCPLCKLGFTSQRNFIVESLVANLIGACINSSNGCNDEFLPEDRKTHELICGFKFVMCPKCEVNISVVHLYTHLLSQCKTLTPIFSMNSLIPLDKKNNVFVSTIFDQQFILHFDKSSEDRKMALRHITLKKSNAYYFEIKLWSYNDLQYKQNVFIDRCEIINTNFPIKVEDFTCAQIRIFKLD